MDAQHPRVDTDAPAPEIRDHRVAPQGVLPRRLQTWIMAGLALIIITVIVLTGRQPPSSVNAAATAPMPPASPPPERIRTFQRELAARSARPTVPAVQTPPPEQPPAGGPPGARDPLTDERRRREYESLFADNLAFSARPGAETRRATAQEPSAPPITPPSPQELAAFQRSLWQGQTGSSGEGLPSAAPMGPTGPSSPSGGTPPPGDVPPPAGRFRILEGTFIEAVLLNRLDGTFSGPVVCLVTTPVYSEDRQTTLIPPGARLLGSVTPVQTWGDSRLAVSFHRLLLPNGDTVSLDHFKGLNAVGQTGLTDSVNRHYLQVFGASVAVGALSGLAQWHTRGGFDAGVGDAYRQSAGASLAASTGRVLDRYLNVLPTITIREGHRIKVYFTNDLYLPAFTSVRQPPSSRIGGVP